MFPKCIPGTPPPIFAKVVVCESIGVAEKLAILYKQLRTGVRNGICNLFEQDSGIIHGTGKGGITVRGGGVYQR